MGWFSSDIDTFDELFVHTLQDIYYAEHQIKKSLPDMIEKASDPELKKKMQHFIDLTYGPGYSFEIIQAKSEAKGESVQNIVQKKKMADDEEVKVQLENHPQIQSIQKIFNGRIGTVTDAKQSNPGRKT